MADLSKHQDSDLLSESKTHLAQQRSLLANQRTYSAWIRTVLSLTAVALALPRIFSVAGSITLARIIGVTMIILAEALLINASIEYSGINKVLREEQGIVAMHPWLFYSITLLLFIGIALSTIILLG